MALTDRQRFYLDTFNPVTLGNGTLYCSCSEADISSYTNPVPTPLSPPFNSKAEGTRELTNFLTNQWPDDTVTDALNQTREIIRTPTPDWGPDVLVRIFRDMDVAFFNCVLRFRVPTVPPQPHQLLDADYKHTPYFVSGAEAARFRDHATPHLIVNLHHPPQKFPPETRHQFPGTDPIMDVGEGGGSKPDELSYEQMAALKDVKDMTVDERKARDAKEFSASPPDILSKAQKERWNDLLMELLDTKEKTAEQKAADDREDPYKTRPRGELRKLKQLADLA